jgi:hypothetical protein
VRRAATLIVAAAVAASPSVCAPFMVLTRRRFEFFSGGATGLSPKDAAERIERMAWNDNVDARKAAKRARSADHA